MVDLVETVTNKYHHDNEYSSWETFDDVIHFIIYFLDDRTRNSCIRLNFGKVMGRLVDAKDFGLVFQ